MIGTVVTHTKYGNGYVSELTSNYIKITFDNTECKTFQYPLAFIQGYLKTSDVLIHKDIAARYSELEKKLTEDCEKREALLESLEKREKKVVKRARKVRVKKNVVTNRYSVTDSQLEDEYQFLFPAGAEDVEFRDAEDEAACVEFLKQNTYKIEAFVTWDRAEDFLAVFPDANYKVVNKKNDATNCSFRLVLNNDSELPDSLEAAKCFYTYKRDAICKSRFIFKLVKKHGFDFV